MAFLGKFDLSSDLTQFYLWAMILVTIFVVLLTWVAPRKGKRSRAVKVDDRFVSVEGDLID